MNGSIEKLTQENWNRVLGVNLIGPSNVVKATLPLLKRSTSGCVVNMASIAGLMGNPNHIYNSSKAALINLSKCLAADLAPYGIRVNSVCPGVIRTPALDQHMAAKGDEERERSWKSKIDHCLLKRIGSAEDVANAVMFLSSAHASFITGTELIVDCGFSVNR